MEDFFSAVALAQNNETEEKKTEENSREEQKQKEVEKWKCLNENSVCPLVWFQYLCICRLQIKRSTQPDNCEPGFDQFKLK